MAKIIYLDGVTISPHTIDAWLASQGGDDATAIQVAAFLRLWYNDSDTMPLHTSGSTGMPKPISVSKAAMVQSARATGQALGLRAGHTAFFAMSMDYIAGQMMVVRALVLGLRLYLCAPMGNPLALFAQPANFVAMVPLQVQHALGQPHTRQLLFACDHIIIGGSAPSAALCGALEHHSGAVYATYGMTETVSHIALRRLNQPFAYQGYRPLPGVSVFLGDDDAIKITAPGILHAPLCTHDRGVLYPDGSFDILGRTDNVVNSGGIKLQVEQLEAAMAPYLAAPFVLTSVPHPLLGQALVLLLQSASADPEALHTTLRRHLPRYHVPRYLCLVDSLPTTATGKVARAQCRALVQASASQLIALAPSAPEAAE